MIFFLSLLLAAWVAVGAVFFGVPAAYFAYMKKRSASIWNLNLDNGYVPSVAVLIPVHNEEKVIRLKLENIARVTYPTEKIEVIVVNDCSTDSTLNEVSTYISAHPEQKITVEVDHREYENKPLPENILLLKPLIINIFKHLQHIIKTIIVL